jgi:hypothetical protein
LEIGRLREYRRGRRILFLLSKAARAAAHRWILSRFDEIHASKHLLMEWNTMKKLASILALSALGLFAVGCNEDAGMDNGPEPIPADTSTDTATGGAAVEGSSSTVDEGGAVNEAPPVTDEAPPTLAPEPAASDSTGPSSDSAAPATDNAAPAGDSSADSADKPAESSDSAEPAPASDEKAPQ